MIEYFAAVLCLIGISTGTWMALKWLRVGFLFKGIWPVYSLAGLFAILPAMPLIFGWATKDSSLLVLILFSIFTLMTALDWLIFCLIFIRELRKRASGHFSFPQLAGYFSISIVISTIAILFVSLFPFITPLEFFIVAIGPTITFIVGSFKYMLYKIQKLEYWRFCIFDSFSHGLFTLTGGLCIVLGYPKFLISLPFIFAMTAAINQIVGLRSLRIVKSPLPATDVVIGNRLAALGELSELTDLLVNKISLEIGEKAVERELTEYIKSDTLFSECQFKKNKIDISSLFKNIGKDPEGLRLQQVFTSFYNLHSALIKLHATFTSSERAREVLNEILTERTAEYGETLYRYSLPLLLNWNVFNSVLKKCGSNTIKSLQTELEVLQKKDPLIASLKLEGNELNLKEFYSKISMLPLNDIIPRTISSFSMLMGAWYPLIRKDLGKQADEMISGAFRGLIEKYPLAVKLGVMKVLPRGVELPGIFRTEPGVSYLVEEARPSRAFKIFEQLIGLGTPALCISRTYPERLRSSHKLSNAQLIWLSKQEVKNAISSVDLDILRDEIAEFVKKQRDGVILLDGFEYLTTMNGFERALEFLHDVQENIIVHRATLLVTINPSAFDEKQFAILGRDMEPIKG